MTKGGNTDERGVLFVHGASDGAYEADLPLAGALQGALGSSYRVAFPSMPTAEDSAFEDWTNVIRTELGKLAGPVVLVGHSVGGSVLLKYLAQQQVPDVSSVHVLAAPFWGADDFWSWEDAELPADAASRLAYVPRLLLYHCQNDEVVPFAHLESLSQLLPQAIVKVVAGRGHQFGNDLAEVAAEVLAAGS